MNQTCNQPTDDIDMDVRKNYVPVGMLRESDNTIHIGRGERLSAAVFNNIIECSKTPSQCVGNIIVSVFPEKLLLTSTISGRSSNKSKSGSTEAKQYHQPNKLDSVKVQACQDLYNYWLKHEYSKLEPNFQYFEEAANFFEYASRKIAYLKRPSRSTPKKGKKAKSKSTHEDESDSPQTLEFVDMQALGAGEEPTNGENSKIINHERENMDKKNENKDESEDSITEKVSEDEYSSIHDSELSETDSPKDPLF